MTLNLAAAIDAADGGAATCPVRLYRGCYWHVNVRQKLGLDSDLLHLRAGRYKKFVAIQLFNAFV